MIKHNLNEWLAYLEQLHPSSIDMGLDRLQQVAQKLQLTRPAPLVITVTGTNGKGSTCAFITALLESQGLKVGLYTSPHLLHYQERVTINQQPVTEAMLCDAFTAIEKARGEISLTYFEFGTLAAFLLFKQAHLDAVVLEVGLGGRLDAVNLIDADIAVVTSIGIDHQEWLGNTRESVAFEKAGIFRKNSPAVCGDNNPPTTLIEQATAKGTPLYIRDKEFNLIIEQDHWQWQGKDKQGNLLILTNIPLLHLPMTNASVAVQVFALLDLPWHPQTIIKTLQQVKVTGRLDQYQLNYQDKTIKLLFDVGHNPHATEFLANYLQQHPVKGKRYAVFGLLADKDLEGVIIPLLSLIEDWAVAPLDTPRSNTAKQLAAMLVQKQQQVTTCTSIEKALLLQADKVTADDEILVFGSFYVVAEGLLWLESLNRK